MHRIYWENSSEADFAFENDCFNSITTNIPSINLPPWLMCVALPNQATLLVDWYRVRKWAYIDPATYVVYDGTPLTALERHTPILCHGGTSTVTIIAVGGTPPYSGTGTFTQSAGTVVYTVTDVFSATDNISVTLTEPAELSVSEIHNDILCHGGNSVVTISAVGGTLPYTGTGIFNHPAGTFVYIVTDANGCTDQVTITLTEPPALVLSADFSELPYPGGTSNVAIGATGGTPPYSGTGTFVQGSGTVVYLVTDANGCAAEITVTLTDPSAWFGLNWKYRKPVNIENPSGTILSNFQVKISLDETFDFSKAKEDGSDLRFADIDKTTLIPFWIETWNPSEHIAEIWVKVPGIPTSGTTVYLYYGNSAPVIPPPNLVETPPTGPFTRAAGNPIVLNGHPLGNNASLLAENIVFDDVTGHYWLVFAEYSSSAGCRVSLVGQSY